MDIRHNLRKVRTNDLKRHASFRMMRNLFPYRFKRLGKLFAEEIHRQASREGFMRKFLIGEKHD